MSNTISNSRLVKPSPILGTLPNLLDEYAAFAHRVRDFAVETIKQQLSYINCLLPTTVFHYETIYLGG